MRRLTAPDQSVRAANGPAGALRTFSLRDITRHSTPEDCWLLVHDRIYDVSTWVPLHPGGALIYVKAGGDCSQLFDAYHPLSARLVLEKFCIGELAEADREGLSGAIVQYQDDTAEGKFYEVLKRRVEKYFRGNEINPRTSLLWCVKAAVILATWAASFYCTFFLQQTFVAALAWACLLGLCMGEIGVSIMHDANHGAGLRSRSGRYLLGLTLDLIGASSFMWKQQHVVGHHAVTNLHSPGRGDPDIRVSAADIRCVTPHHPRHAYHGYQHVYLAFLYSLLALKSVLLDDFVSYAGGAIGDVALARMTPLETGCFWGGKALYAAYFIAAPIAASPHGWPALLALWLASEFVAGYMLALMFQVAHVTGDVEFLQSADGKVARGWAAAQVATTADFSHGSWFWTQFSGGLNYQVVHHLFPNVCHTHYPAIAPIVLATCAEFGVPYKVYPSFWSALCAHFKHLRAMGTGLHIPSLATVG